MWFKAYNDCHHSVNTHALVTAQVSDLKLHIEREVCYSVQDYGRLMLE